jgi:hypothetical protein
VLLAKVTIESQKDLPLTQLDNTEHNNDDDTISTISVIERVAWERSMLINSLTFIE